MKIALFGSNGLIGRHLAQHFLNKGDSVLSISRHAKNGNCHARLQHFQWDAENLGNWQGALEDVDVVINLCGRTVNCRYNESSKGSTPRGRGFHGLPPKRGPSG